MANDLNNFINNLMQVNRVNTCLLTSIATDLIFLFFFGLFQFFLFLLFFHYIIIFFIVLGTCTLCFFISDCYFEVVLLCYVISLDTNKIVYTLENSILQKNNSIQLNPLRPIFVLYKILLLLLKVLRCPLLLLCLII